MFLSFPIFIFINCSKSSGPEDLADRDYRQDMRDFVQNINAYAQGIDSDFLIIPQNGQELLTVNGDPGGAPASGYIAAIDGVGREDLFYGYNSDNTATPASEQDYMIAFMDVAENNGIQVLVTDYCWTHTYVDDSYTQNAARGYISFAAFRELDNIPAYPLTPYNENSSNINSLTEAKNFLYLINPGSYSTKTAFLNAIQVTNFDLILIDLFYDGTEELSADEVATLKVKTNGGIRLVIAYMSIGEAEDYRYYWQAGWQPHNPSWLSEENPDWPGNYKVHYWDQNWQSIIYGNDASYLKKILDAGFDGAYLDIIDAFEYFENL